MVPRWRFLDCRSCGTNADRLGQRSFGIQSWPRYAGLSDRQYYRYIRLLRQWLQWFPGIEYTPRVLVTALSRLAVDEVPFSTPFNSLSSHERRSECQTVLDGSLSRPVGLSVGFHTFL